MLVREPRLRGYNVFEFWFDLNGGETGGIPSAAERFYKENTGNEFLAADDGHLLLVVEQILLGADDVEIADEAAFVAAFCDVQSAARGIHGVLLRFLRFVQ